MTLVEPFEHHLSQHLRRNNPLSERRLLKFTLKIEEAPSLLKGLHRLGIDASSVFTGGDGIAKSLQERAWWAR